MIYYIKKWKNEFIYSFDQNWGESHSQFLSTLPIAMLQLIERVEQKPGNMHMQIYL
jgi:hypothetical protein